MSWLMPVLSAGARLTVTFYEQSGSGLREYLAPRWRVTTQMIQAVDRHRQRRSGSSRFSALSYSRPRAPVLLPGACLAAGLRSPFDLLETGRSAKDRAKRGNWR